MGKKISWLEELIWYLVMGIDWLEIRIKLMEVGMFYRETIMIWKETKTL